MSKIGGLPENQARPGLPTTSVRNKDGEWIAWDLVREACDTAHKTKDDSSILTVSEASRKFGISVQAIQGKVKRDGWKILRHYDKKKILEREEKDWGKRGEKHREKAFRVAHESLKKFRPRTPKDFKELEIADRIARRAAGLENDSIVQQTLVHINEAVEGHAEAQVIEASLVDNTPQLDQEEPTVHEQPSHNPNTAIEVS